MDNVQDPEVEYGQDENGTNVYSGNQQISQQVNQDNVFNQFSPELIENFKNVFDHFDRDRTGLIETKNLERILGVLGFDPNYADELVQKHNIQGDRMSFNQFIYILYALDQEIRQDQQDKADQELTGEEATLGDRNKYGPLLPRSGVHFLPDSKVVDCLKILNDYRRQCCSEMNLTQARRAQLKFEDLKNKEMLRQLQNMRQAQEQELITVEKAQRSQFQEFSSAWDNYMSDYEATAYLSLEKLKEKHQIEIQQLHEKIRAEHSVKVQLSKELMEMKDRVKKLMYGKRLEEAEILQIQCQQLEQEEYERQDFSTEETIERQEALLRQKQQQALSALLKRIQRDRNEQLKHRQIDSQRLIQRNKNLLLDLLNKQNMETRRTNNFLRMALSSRSPSNPKYYKSKFYDADTRIKMPNQRLKTANIDERIINQQSPRDLGQNRLKTAEQTSNRKTHA